MTKDETNHIYFSSLTEVVSSQKKWIVGCVPVTEDVASQTDWIEGCDPVTKDETS
jgi:hypothetical protein